MATTSPGPEVSLEPNGGHAATSAQAVVIPAELEKALFLRFWAWLGIVAGILFTLGGVTAGAVGFWITSHLTNVGERATSTASAAAKAAVDASSSTMASRIEEVLMRSKELYSQSFALATELARSAGASTEHARTIKANLDESNQLLTSLRAAASLSPERHAGLNQSELISALSKNVDFARLAATGLGGLFQGAVLAFDSSSCPDGWQAFSDGAGKFLMGSNSQRPFRSVGGAETVVLSALNLPEHSHETLVGVLAGTSPFGHSAAPNPQAIFGARQGLTFVANTAPAGFQKPTPIGILPPYISLTLCRKACRLIHASSARRERRRSGRRGRRKVLRNIPAGFGFAPVCS